MSRDNLDILEMDPGRFSQQFVTINETLPTTFKIVQKHTL